MCNCHEHPSGNGTLVHLYKLALLHLFVSTTRLFQCGGVCVYIMTVGSVRRNKCSYSNMLLIMHLSVCSGNDGCVFRDDFCAFVSIHVYVGTKIQTTVRNQVRKQEKVII